MGHYVPLKCTLPQPPYMVVSETLSAYRLNSRLDKDYNVNKAMATFDRS